MEMIDSGQMQVCREFAAADEVVDNSERFRVGLLGETVVIASDSGGGGWSGDLFFERANLADVIRALDEVLAANPFLGLVERGVTKGQDLLGVRTYEEGGAYHQSGQIRVMMNNNRPAMMDGMQLSSWNIRMTVDTAHLVREALGNI